VVIERLLVDDGGLAVIHRAIPACAATPEAGAVPKVVVVHIHKTGVIPAVPPEVHAPVVALAITTGLSRSSETHEDGGEDDDRDETTHVGIPPWGSKMATYIEKAVPVHKKIVSRCFCLFYAKSKVHPVRAYDLAGSSSIRRHSVAVHLPYSREGVLRESPFEERRHQRTILTFRGQILIFDWIPELLSWHEIRTVVYTQYQRQIPFRVRMPEIKSFEIS
jgi:hypothetical protein